MDCVNVVHVGSVAIVKMARPEVKNAFNPTLIRELGEAFRGFDSKTRVAVLSGEGDAFSAGADLSWMKSAAAKSDIENKEDASVMLDMFSAIDEAPCAVVACVNGHAFGGALGLISCADVAICVDTAKMGFSEVRLGLAPAVISAFVMRKIGQSFARRYFVTGQTFGAKEALAMSLVHEVVGADELDAAVQKVVMNLMAASPEAVKATKKLIRDVYRLDAKSSEEALRHAVGVIAKLRASDDGQEGLSAFLEKRKPRWIPTN